MIRQYCNTSKFHQEEDQDITMMMEIDQEPGSFSCYDQTRCYNMNDIDSDITAYYHTCGAPSILGCHNMYPTINHGEPGNFNIHFYGQNDNGQTSQYQKHRLDITYSPIHPLQSNHNNLNSMNLSKSIVKNTTWRRRNPATSRRDMNISMPTAIIQKRYDIVQSKLKRLKNEKQCQGQGHPCTCNSSRNNHLANCTHGHFQECDPNEEILFQTRVGLYMTGLEYSVYNHDWRMAIIFYMNAADPIYNCFDGRVIDVEDDSYQYEMMEDDYSFLDDENLDPNVNNGIPVNNAIHASQDRTNSWLWNNNGVNPAPPQQEPYRNIISNTISPNRNNSNRFHPLLRSPRSPRRSITNTNSHGHTRTTPNMYHQCENNGMPIAGFKGLYCLLNPTVQGYRTTLSALWLMEQCYTTGSKQGGASVGGYSRNPDLFDYTLSHARDCLLEIGAGKVWNEEFCGRVYAILKSLEKAVYGHRHSPSCNRIHGADGSFDTDMEMANAQMNVLPNEICLNILDYVIDDILSFTIWKGLMYGIEEVTL